jgi:hypothetical protein
MTCPHCGKRTVWLQWDVLGEEWEWSADVWADGFLWGAYEFSACVWCWETVSCWPYRWGVVS